MIKILNFKQLKIGSVCLVSLKEIDKFTYIKKLPTNKLIKIKELTC